jgi:hypothetical protein
MLLEQINGPSPGYAIAGLEKQEQEKIKKGNEKLCDWIKNVFVKNANEEAKKIGLACALEDVQLGTSTKPDQSRFWKEFSKTVEEHRRKEKLQKAMAEVRAYAGDAFVEKFSITLNGGTVNFQHNQVDGNPEAESVSLDERKKMTKFYFDKIEKVGGIAVLPIMNAHPHLFLRMQDEVTKVSDDSLARAQVEKLRDELLDVRSDIATSSQSDSAAVAGAAGSAIAELPQVIHYGCPWCNKNDIENESDLQNHFSQSGSLQCKQCLDALVNHPALLKPAKDRVPEEKILFKETNKLPAIDAVMRFRQGSMPREAEGERNAKSQGLYPPGPLWPTGITQKVKIWYSLQKADAAYKQKNRALLTQTLKDYPFKTRSNN